MVAPEPTGCGEIPAAMCTWRAAGFSTLPAAALGSERGAKRPDVDSWTEYQKHLPTEEQVIGWAPGARGFGMVTGVVSGGAIMVELEGRAVEDGLYDLLRQRFTDAGHAELWDRLQTYVEQSPKVGLHWVFRVEGEFLVDGKVPRNTKLAERPRTPTEDNPNDRETLAETRAEGGFTMLAPSSGECHPDGKPWVIVSGKPGVVPTFTADETSTIFKLFGTLNELPPPPPQVRTPSPATPRKDGELSPGDDFNARADWDKDVLGPFGWQFMYQRSDDTEVWCRPGKNPRDGASATTGYGNQGHDLFYPFTTSTVFEAEKSYSKFGAFTALRFGDTSAASFKAATKELGALGYGDELPPLKHGDSLLSVTYGEGGESAAANEQAPMGDAQPQSGDPEPQPAAAKASEPPRAGMPDLTPLWERESLARLRDFARARRVGPLAVIACALARVAVTIPAEYVLPPLVGSYATPDLYISLVGLSGGGKGTAIRASGAGLDLDHWTDPKSGLSIYMPNVGSGEGLLRAYAHWDTKEKAVVRDRQSVLFRVPEIDHLGAVGSRQGATLMPMLRSGWSGEDLAPQYSDDAKRLHISEYSYRCSLIAGVQPGKAGVLLDDADGGTPQRFLWVPVSDPDAPDRRPPEPARWRVKTLGQPTPWNAKKTIAVCTEAREAIDRHNLAVLHEDARVDPLDGHRLLLQEKVAAALAALDGHLGGEGITGEDWELAGVLMAVSDATRQKVESQQRDRAIQTNRARGHADGERESAKVEVVEKTIATKASRAVLTFLSRQSPGQWITHGDLRRAIKSSARAGLGDALELLEATGQVEAEPIPGQGRAGMRYRRRVS